MEDREKHRRREKRRSGGKSRKRELEEVREKILEKLREDGEEDDDEDEEVETDEDQNEIQGKKELISMGSGEGGRREEGGGRREEGGGRREENGGRRETWKTDSDDGWERKPTSQIDEGKLRNRVSIMGGLAGMGSKSFYNVVTMGMERKLRASSTKINFTIKEELFMS